MGTIIHDAVVVMGYDDDKFRKVRDRIEALKEKALPGFGPIKLFVTPCYAGVNGYMSFAILPDGSKEFWDHSDACDRLRAKAREIAGDYEWVQVQFGSDRDGGPRIVQADGGGGGLG